MQRHMLTRNDVIAIMRDLAAKNGGWLNTLDYYRLAPKGRLQHQTLCRTLGVKTWAEACEVAEIKVNEIDTFGDELTVAQCQRVIAISQVGGGTPPALKYRQQAAMYCLRVVANRLNRHTFTSAEYNAAADPNMYHDRAIRDAFGGWNLALHAAGLEVKHTGGNRVQKGRDERDGKMMEETAANKWPANWRTIYVGFTTLEPVTEVTVYALANGLGLRHTEVRACIR